VYHKKVRKESLINVENRLTRKEGLMENKGEEQRREKRMITILYCTERGRRRIINANHSIMKSLSILRQLVYTASTELGPMSPRSYYPPSPSKWF
jgi:hypothetical protein